MGGSLPWQGVAAAPGPGYSGGMRTVLLVLIGAVPAAVHPAHAMTWAEARAEAQRRAPELAVGIGHSQVAHAEVDVAAALANPNFTVTTASESARLGAGVSVPLPLFGQRAAAVQAARADAEAVDREHAVLLNDLRWNASLAWVEAWDATRRARLLAGAAEDARRLASIAS